MAFQSQGSLIISKELELVESDLDKNRLTIIGIILDESTNTYYLRANNWVYRFDFYDKDKKLLLGVDFSNPNVAYLGIGDAFFNWNSTNGVNIGVEIKDLFLVFENKYYYNEKYLEFSISTQAYFDFNNRSANWAMTLTKYAVRVDTKTGRMLSHLDVFDNKDVYDRRHYVIDGEPCDIRFIVFGDDRVIVRM